MHHGMDEQSHVTILGVANYNSVEVGFEARLGRSRKRDTASRQWQAGIRVTAIS